MSPGRPNLHPRRPNLASGWPKPARDDPEGPPRRMRFTLGLLAATPPSSRQLAWWLLWDWLVGIRET
eukprot:6300045-Pyramimonas_sp.AAC.1